MTANGRAAVADSDILLTGATGFVGAFLLRRLLESSAVRVHCLVRSMTEPEAMERIRSAQIAYGLDLPDQARVVPVAGDLAAAGLGLSPERFDDLARSVTTVIHAAARVNLVMPARMLEAANVAGTREILRLARQGGAAVRFISTSEVFGRARGVVDEDTPALDCYEDTSGYGRTKRAAESLVLQARRDGLPAAVLRLDRVAGDSRTGACQSDGDDLWLLVRSALSTGVLPDALVNLTPVDFAADAVLALTAAPAGSEPIAHICHPWPTRMTDVATALNHVGWPVRVLPATEWAMTLQRLGEQPDCDPMVRLLPIIADRVMGGRPLFRAPRTTATLRRLGLHHPPVDVPLLGKYVRHLTATGFLPATYHRG
ncbi:thioester reductase domain-containing protein [Nonomuraea sp. B12E4]|uniref:thioester reductase domain-containing protein n=1 Tax=Nonomuraea sp. B12E4 TaxID=3153564 RepID=UPI00325E63BA